jgi:hypothetical protein
VKRRKLIAAPYYPFLIAALPILHFYDKDLGSTLVWQVIRLLLVYWMIVALLLFVARRAWRDPTRGSLVCGACAGPLFYGGSVEWPKLVVAVAAIVAIAVGLKKTSISLVRWVPALNIACGVLVLFPIGSILKAQRNGESPHPIAGYADALPLPAVPRGELPDIYFILADGLAHPAIFQSMYGVPRQSFERPLGSLGFHIVPGSRSNYAQTALSLSSTLNMEYVQDLLRIPNRGNDDRRPLARLITRNRVVSTLRTAGYRIVSMPAEYDLAQLADADVSRRPLFAPGFFELHTVRNTILPHLMRLVGRGPADLEFALHRRRVEFVLRELPRARADVPHTDPILVYAHIIAPHPPFVYGRNGERLASRQRFGFSDGDHWLMERHGDREQYVREYRDQALYMVEQLAVTVEAIIRKAQRPLVIVVQGDHGPGSELRWDNLRLTNKVERHGIFNAWFTSTPQAAVPPAGMSAVNTFRFLFNSHFGTKLPLLADRAWYSRWIAPYSFSELPRSP